MKEITITKNDANRRLDKFLRKYLCNASLSQIYKIIRKDLKVNNRKQDESYILEIGDKLCFYIKDEEYTKLIDNKTSKKSTQTKKQFETIYEDENILITNKPFGLLTHGDSKEKKNHLSNQVKDYLIANGEYNPRLEKVFSPAPANRLDRNTTGLVLFGKNALSLQALNKIIRENKTRKFYLTIIHGIIKKEQILDGILYKDSEKNQVIIDNSNDKNLKNITNKENGLPVKTIIKPLQELKENFTLVVVELITGRSHQIRAHLASIGHPIIGDSKYATKSIHATNKILSDKYDLSTQLLHAFKLEFQDDINELSYLTGKSFYANLPEKFKNILIDLDGDAKYFNDVYSIWEKLFLICIKTKKYKK